jgi:hypothetical protein
MLRVYDRAFCIKLARDKHSSLFSGLPMTFEMYVPLTLGYFISFSDWTIKLERFP